MKGCLGNNLKLIAKRLEKEKLDVDLRIYGFSLEGTVGIKNLHLLIYMITVKRLL